MFSGKKPKHKIIDLNIYINILEEGGSEPLDSQLKLHLYVNESYIYDLFEARGYKLKLTTCQILISQKFAGQKKNCN